MNRFLISKICLAVALILTVYNFLIIESPVSREAIGTIFLLLIASNVLTNFKQSN